MKQIVVGVAITALLTGLGTVVPATAEPTRAATAAPAGVRLGPSTISWHSCQDPYLAGQGAQCALLPVPLDYSKPTGRKIRLAVSRVVHTSTAASFQGVMLVNPGGPGGSGLQLATLGQYVPQHAGDVYDWIGWDPRGVGASVPSLTCKPKYFGYNRPEYVPTTEKLLTTWLHRSKGYADACQKAQPALLKHLKTIDSVRDMESIRRALGAAQINYYGFSYGTYLGAVYGTRHPTRLRRMVLDGNVDPRGVWYQANLDQDPAFERNIKTWFAWVAKYDSIYHLGRTDRSVAAKYYAQLKQLDKKPAGGKIGSAEWNDIFVYAGYYQSTWEEIAEPCSPRWVNDHDFQRAQGRVRRGHRPSAMTTGSPCTRLCSAPTPKWPAKHWSTWQKDNDKTSTRRRSSSPGTTPGTTRRATTGTRRPGTPVKVNGSKVASALMISETKDAATPFSGSHRAAASGSRTPA